MRRYLLSILVPLLLMLVQNSAFAGERAGAFSISPFAGGYNFEIDQRRDYDLRQNRQVYGLRLGYDLSDHFEAELVGKYIDAEMASAHRDVQVYGYGLDLLYNFMPHSRFVPYAAIGGGGLSFNYPGEGADGTDGALNAGVGFKLFLANSVAFRVDGRYILDIGNRGIDNWEYTAGLTFLFGGGKKAAAAAGGAVEEQPPQQQMEKEAPLEQVPAAEPTPGHYKYCVTLGMQFDIDQAVVRPEYRDEIAKVGDFMKQYPTTTAVIEGHTDNVGDPDYNMGLSQRRAEAVVDYLVTNFGIDRSRLTAKGYGMTRPIADNSTDVGKQKNRRIQAVIDCTFTMQEVRPSERLCVSLVIDFDPGQAAIKPQYNDEIAKLADYMRRYPTTTALIEGHTDNVGGYDYNMKLSQKRADAVVNYLVDNFGIDRSRLSAKGYGYTRRIAYNDTEEGRQKNRRINAVIDCVVRP
ncbi:OmpA family protein [Geomesophilobacter sediminis]|uniref:OmpA family protein n=1 Tax=Geomesophilobacter sediminis TaxID=2798584 RepID=A0A8J7LYQ6_9BACT|nr:OmpA family protein [Geomesophilobacter sediminis]MBJ6725401.1 OmpA family protein [Geomesophilobacter sediminis]